MKKLYFVLLCVLMLFALASCKTVAVSFEPVIEVSIDGEDVADVTIVPEFEGDSGIYFSAGTKGYSLTVENKTDSIIKIVWEKSAIYYEGNSSLPFITGQKYIDHNSPMSPTIIPAHGKNTTSVYSADQVYYVSGRYGGWRMSNIAAFDTQVVICIEANGNDTYYVISVSGNPIYPEED